MLASLGFFAYAPWDKPHIWPLLITGIILLLGGLVVASVAADKNVSGE
jgi:hypothetical protein